MKQLDPTAAKRLHRGWRRRTDGRVALLLDGVQQPYNVGAIFRAAAAFRVERVWLVGGTPPPTAPGARKTALGSDRYVEWSHAATAVDAVDDARARGFRIVGVELATDARPIHELDLMAPCCLAIGHEDRGLSRNCLEACDEVGYIPQLGRVGSLNVAAATAIAIYESRRQEWTRP